MTSNGMKMSDRYRHMRHGWSWGTTDSGEWLTILGSHHRAPVLAPTPEDAVRNTYYDQPWMEGRGILARVTEVYHPGVSGGRAYRIHEIHNQEA